MPIPDDPPADPKQGHAEHCYGWLSNETDPKLRKICRCKDPRGLILLALMREFEATIHHFETKNQGGQHVPFHGDFANVAPSVAGRMRWWVREMKEALLNGP